MSCEHQHAHLNGPLFIGLMACHRLVLWLAIAWSYGLLSAAISNVDNFAVIQMTSISVGRTRRAASHADGHAEQLLQPCLAVVIECIGVVSVSAARSGSRHSPGEVQGVGSSILDDQE